MKTPWRVVPLGVWNRDSYEKANAFDADGKRIVFDDAAVLRTVVNAINQVGGKVFRVLEFNPLHSPHINWQSIAETARECGANFRSEWDREGGCKVTIYWPAESLDSK